jgi:hypothetical protein
MEMKLKKKYREPKSGNRHAVYKGRTCFKIRLGYHKHQYAGLNVPSYPRRKDFMRGLSV